MISVPERIRRSETVILLSVACALLGVMMTWALKNEITARDTGGGRTRLSGQRVQSEQAQISEQREEIVELRGKLAELEKASVKRGELEKVFSDEIRSLKVFAGLVDVEGPGITVLLRDSQKIPTLAPTEVIEPYMIHDTDLLRVVNELRAAGAEVIAVNGHRLTGRSSVRCVGPVVQLDGESISAPFRIEAIGNPRLLKAAMDLPGGVLEPLRRLDPDMVEIVVEEKLRIPAYGGTTKANHARPAEAEKQ